MTVLRFLRDTAMDLCLGCRHDHLTRPFTIQADTYMVCLDCGRQLAYSAETMRPLSRREARRRRKSSLALVPTAAAHAATAPVSAEAASDLAA
jgi:hypothetical protein